MAEALWRGSAWQPVVTDPYLHPVDGGEGQLGHHPTIEDGVEH